MQLGRAMGLNPHVGAAATAADLPREEVLPLPVPAAVLHIRVKLPLSRFPEVSINDSRNRSDDGLPDLALSPVSVDAFVEGVGDEVPNASPDPQPRGGSPRQQLPFLGEGGKHAQRVESAGDGIARHPAFNQPFKYLSDPLRFLVINDKNPRRILAFRPVAVRTVAPHPRSQRRDPIAAMAGLLDNILAGFGGNDGMNALHEAAVGSGGVVVLGYAANEESVLSQQPKDGNGIVEVAAQSGGLVNDDLRKLARL